MYATTTLQNDLYLSHHGILGMKWGIRRYQNEDGSLTKAGQIRYNKGVINATKKLEKTNKKLLNTFDDDKDYKLAVYDQKVAKQELRDAKIHAKIEANGGLTKAQEKYKQRYLDKGMNEAEAEVAAYRHDRTKKILMAGAGVAVAAIGTYAAYKYGQYNFDQVIPKGTKLSRISSTDSDSVHDAFYAVLDRNATDKQRYGGIYGQQLSFMGQKVFSKKINSTDSLRIASPKNATEVMRRALDNTGIRKNKQAFDTFKEQMTWRAKFDQLYGIEDRYKLGVKALDELETYKKTGKVGKNLYANINTLLAERSLPITSEFYKELKKAGYDGVKDLNDSDYSGFMTKFPIIIANASKVKVESVRQLNPTQIGASYAAATLANDRELLMKEITPRITSMVAGGAAAIGGTVATKTIVDTKRKDAMVDKYRTEHPNTKKSYNEIVQMLERESINS